MMPKITRCDGDVPIGLEEWPVEMRDPGVLTDYLRAKFGLTEEERKVVGYLVQFWNEALPLLTDVTQLHEVQSHLHGIQSIFALRVAKRCDPDFWI